MALCERIHLSGRQIVSYTHRTHGQENLVEHDRERDSRASQALGASIASAVQRIRGQRFSTRRIIDELRSDRSGEEAYQAALGIVAGGSEVNQMALHVLHGQIIPEVLRHSGLVRFAGFIHGMPDEDDGFSVPSWWRRV
jgi:hypothetical protein